MEPIVNVDGGILIGEVICGAPASGMVCEYTTGRYAKETRANLQKNLKAFQSELPPMQTNAKKMLYSLNGK